MVVIRGVRGVGGVRVVVDESLQDAHAVYDVEAVVRVQVWGGGGVADELAFGEGGGVGVGEERVEDGEEEEESGGNGEVHGWCCGWLAGLGIGEVGWWRWMERMVWCLTFAAWVDGVTVEGER